MALLAGDGLLTEAFHLLSSAEATRGATPELVVQAMRELARLWAP
jgi:geranylgeranyl pyrophosphate synthase